MRNKTLKLTAAALLSACSFAAMGAGAVLPRPEPPLAKLLPTIVGTAVSLVVLWYLAPRGTARATDGDAPVVQPMGVDRRRFVATSDTTQPSAARTALTREARLEGSFFRAR